MSKVNQEFVVYGLYSTERPTHIRYVGQAVDLKNRMYNHNHSARTGQKQPVYHWMRSVRKRGYEVRCRVLVSNAVYNESEIQMIAHLKPTGLLLNQTVGGMGALGRQVSEETKLKISSANTGKRRSPDVVDNFKKWRRSWTPPRFSDETKEKMRQAKLGRPSPLRGVKNRWSEEDKKRIGLQSKERIQRSGHPRAGKSVSDETRKKIAQTLMGRKLPEAVRQKMRDAHARRLANG